MQTKWDLTQLLANDDFNATQTALDKVKANVATFVNKWEPRKDYLEDPKILKEALDEYEHLSATQHTFGKVGFYWLLKNTLDSDNPTVKKRVALVQETYTKLDNDLLFFEHRLSQIKKSAQKKFLNSAELNAYHHYLNSLFKTSKYLLTEKEEKIIGLLLKSASSDWQSMVSDLLSKAELKVINEKEEKITIPRAELTKYLKSKNKKVRDTASRASAKLHKKYAEIAERELNAILYTKKVLGEQRGVSRPDEFRHVSDDIDSKIVDTMRRAVTDNFSTSSKWYELKAKLLGDNKMDYHERVVDLGEYDKKFTFKDSVELCKNVFADLDSEFLLIFENMLKSGQIDVFPKKGKRGGAFSWGALKSTPNFVLLNHTDTLYDVTTLAHEMGHAIHGYLNNKQNALNWGHSLAIAEVASTFMEDFVLAEVLKNATKKEKFAILSQKIDSDIGSIYRQVACYNFEYEMHTLFAKANFLSTHELSEIFVNHMKSYMGPGVRQNFGAKVGWVGWPHIRNNFYVYSYASGLLISKSLQSMVREDKKNIKKVKQMLAAGASKPPTEIFADVGIDITDDLFWQRGLDEVLQLYSELEELTQDLSLT